MTDAAALQRARAAFERRAWADAHARLSSLDREILLEAEDLERLATAAFLVGRDDVSDDSWARARRQFLRQDQLERAARR